MNMNNLLAQLGKATNPMSMLMNMLTPNQNQQLSQFQSRSKEEQCRQIAEYCNANGIDKEKLQSIINMLNKR